MGSKVLGPMRGGGVTPTPLYVGPLRAPGGALVYAKPSFVFQQDFTNVVAVDPNGYVTSKTSAALPDAAGTVTFTPDGALTGGVPDLPRNVVITVTHASAVVAASGVITGTDEYGSPITEAWSVTAGTTSKVFTGAVAFAVVSSVTYVTGADATTNTFIMGTGKVLGLSLPADAPVIVAELSGGTAVTNGVLVAASTTSNEDTRGTYTPNGTPNGTLDFSIWYIGTSPATVL